MAFRPEEGQERLIVMPFRPAAGQAFRRDFSRTPGPEADGRGLGLHFLAGNLICLHRGFRECWFGWRVKKIFPDVERLLSYCGGAGGEVDFKILGEREKVRFWLEGEYTGGEAGGEIGLVLHDTRDEFRSEVGMAYSLEDGLLGFRKRFFDWLDQIELGFIELGVIGSGFAGREAGSWPEKISAPGLDALGQALRELYVSYVGGGDVPQGQPPIDLAAFRKAVTESPESYLARNLLGWGLYKNNDFSGAVKAFDRALALNPAGMAAHAGRMWIALAEKDRETALHHAMEKGRCRGEAPERARIFVAKKLG